MCRLLVDAKDGIALADIPWRATPEEESAVSLIVGRINEGRDVQATVAPLTTDWSPLATTPLTFQP